MPSTVSGTVAGNMVTGTVYNGLGQMTEINLGNSLKTTYNQIGNITSKNGTSYTYGSKPHAVTAVGSTNYTYDANGSMTARGSQSITWDVENRAICVNGVSTYVYDGDGNRVKKTEGGQTVLYINKYYEKNLDTGEVTTSYYLGNKQVALRKGTTLSYIQQDHLTGTSVISNTSGSATGTIKYFSFGATRSTTGTIPTDKKFTGQRLDGTGLYYYGARYYDPSIGRFISADKLVQTEPGKNSKAKDLTVNSIPLKQDKDNFENLDKSPNHVLVPLYPQNLNRYSYTINNPLRYTDLGGWWTLGFGLNFSIGILSEFVASTMFVSDNKDVAWVDSTGTGEELGYGLSEGFQIQITDASSLSSVFGQSAYRGIELGLITIDIIEGGKGSGRYSGIQISLGPPAFGFSVGMHRGGVFTTKSGTLKDLEFQRDFMTIISQWGHYDTKYSLQQIKELISKYKGVDLDKNNKDDDEDDTGEDNSDD